MILWSDKGGDPVVTHEWFVCPTVSMVTTSHATGHDSIGWP